jgi:hypothetical protein
MRGKLLLGLLASLAVLGFASAALSGEEANPPAAADTQSEIESSAKKDRTYLSTQLMEELNKKVKEYQDEDWKTRSAASDTKKKGWDDEFQKVIAPQEGKFDYNGKPVTFKEPRRPGEIIYKAKEPYKPWSLRADAFKFDLPVEIHEARPQAKDRTYVVLPYSVTNTLVEVKVSSKVYDQDKKESTLEVFRVASDEAEAVKIEQDIQETAKRLKQELTISHGPAKAMLTPRITMVTDGGVFTPEVCGFIPHESVEVSTMTKRSWTAELLGFMREKTEVGALEPGQTKPGVAIFPYYDPATTSVRFLIEGLADQKDFKKDLRKALVLEFVRPGNIYYPGQVKLAFKRRIGGKLIDPKAGYVPAVDDEVHHGFDWVWLWNWEAAAKVTEAPKTSELATPTGGDKQKFWFYKLTIPNRTGEEQPLTIEKVTTVIQLKILDKVVDVPFPDDGTLNVYKTDFFEKEGKPATPKRFPNGVKVASGDENAVSFWVAFRESDFDFDAVCRNLVNAFNLDLAKARNAGGEKATYETVASVAKFDAAKMEQARKELIEKIPAALAEQLAKRVAANLTVKSDLASGTRAVSYSLYQPAFKPEPEKKP